jgi:hypothetical protein
MYADLFGAVEPADTAVASPPGGTFADVGGTNGGITIRVTKEFAELEVDQLIETAERRCTKIETVLATSLAEPTLENLTRALNQDPATAISAGTGYEAIDVVAADPFVPIYQAIIIDGRAPAGKRRRVIARKAVNTQDMEKAYAKGDQTLVPVELTCHYVSASIKSVHIVDAV